MMIIEEETETRTGAAAATMVYIRNVVPFSSASSQQGAEGEVRSNMIGCSSSNFSRSTRLASEYELVRFHQKKKPPPPNNNIDKTKARANHNDAFLLPLGEELMVVTTTICLSSHDDGGRCLLLSTVGGFCSYYRERNIPAYYETSTMDEFFCI